MKARGGRTFPLVKENPEGKREISQLGKIGKVKGIYDASLEEREKSVTPLTPEEMGIYLQKRKD